MFEFCKRTHAPNWFMNEFHEWDKQMTTPSSPEKKDAPALTGAPNLL